MIRSNILDSFYSLIQMGISIYLILISTFIEIFRKLLTGFQNVVMFILTYPTTLLIIPLAIVLYLIYKKRRDENKILNKVDDIFTSRKIDTSLHKEDEHTKDGTPLAWKDNYFLDITLSKEERDELTLVAARILYINRAKTLNFLDCLSNDTKGSFQSSVVLSIEGRWGDGKTSYMNLLIQAIAKKVGATGEIDNFIRDNVLEFNPWGMIIQSEKDLATRLIQDMSNKIERQLGRTDSKEIKKYLRAYENTFVNTIETLGSLYGKNLDSVIKKLKTDIEQLIPNADLQKLISNKFAELQSPIVVIIDDIDRLGPEEIYQLTKLMRAGVSFPNVIFILCLDRSRIGEVLKDYGGLEYLEKVIDISYSVANYRYPGSPLQDNCLGLERRATDGASWSKFSIDWLSHISKREQIEIYNELISRLEILKIKNIQSYFNLEVLIRDINNSSSSNFREYKISQELIPALMGVIISLKYPNQAQDIIEALNYIEIASDVDNILESSILSISKEAEGNRMSKRFNCKDNYNCGEEIICLRHQEGAEETILKNSRYLSLMKLIHSENQLEGDSRLIFLAVLNPSLPYWRGSDHLIDKLAGHIEREFRGVPSTITSDDIRELLDAEILLKKVRLKYYFADKMFSIDPEGTSYPRLVSATSDMFRSIRLSLLQSGDKEDFEACSVLLLFTYEVLTNIEFGSESRRLRRKGTYEKMLNELNIWSKNTDPLWLLLLSRWESARDVIIDKRTTKESSIWRNAHTQTIDLLTNFRRDNFIGEHDRLKSGEILASIFMLNQESLNDSSIKAKNSNGKIDMGKVFNNFILEKDAKTELREILRGFFETILQHYLNSSSYQIDKIAEEAFHRASRCNEYSVNEALIKEILITYFSNIEGEEEVEEFCKDLPISLSPYLEGLLNQVTQKYFGIK